MNFQLEQLEEETVVWCREILRNSPMAIRLCKSSLNAVEDGHAGLQVIFSRGSLSCRLQTTWHNGLFPGGLWCNAHIHGILCISEGYSWNLYIVYAQKWIFNTLNVSISFIVLVWNISFIAPKILVSGIDPPGLLLMHLTFLSVSTRRLFGLSKFIARHSHYRSLREMQHCYSTTQRRVWRGRPLS